MSQQQIIRYRCPNVDCPTRRGSVGSWWEIISMEDEQLRCPFCENVYTRDQLERETQNHINEIRGRQPGRWPQETRSTFCGHCNRQTMTLYGQNSNGQTTATCTECNPPSPPRPVTLGSLSHLSPMSQARSLSSRSRSSSPPSQGVLFDNLYSPPSSPLRPPEGKVETQAGEKIDVGQIPSPNRADALTQQFADSQPSPPSSPPSGQSSGERALNRGPPRLSVASRLALRARARQSSRANQTLAQRLQATRDLMRFEGRRDFSSSDEESDDEGPRNVPATPREREQWRKEREQRIIAERKELHKAVPPSGAAGGGNDTYELKQTIIKAIKTDIRRPQPSADNLMNQPKQQKIKLSSTRSKSATEPRELFHPIMMDMDLIESLQDNDEIIFQLDKPPYNGYSIPKSFLRDFLTKHEYLQHTKYQCMGTGEHALMITENNIVFEHNNRSFFQFINGSGLGIPLGLFLRQQLLDALNVKEKYFLIHVHENTDINPIVSADEVQWYAPPVLNSTTTHFRVEGEQIPNWGEPIPNIPSNQFVVLEDTDFRGYDETHTQLTTNVSADHCQPSNGSKRHLLTIRHVNKDILRFIEHRTKTGATKRKRRGGKRKTKKKKRKKNKRKKSRRRRKQKGGRRKTKKKKIKKKKRKKSRRKR